VIDGSKGCRDLLEGTRSRLHRDLCASKTVQDLGVGRRFRPRNGRDLEVVRQDIAEAAQDGQFLHRFRWFLVQDVSVATFDLEKRSRRRPKSVVVRSRKGLDLEVWCPFLEVRAAEDWIECIHRHGGVMNANVTYIKRSITFLKLP
jgi:hypothetical protein